MTEPTQAAKQRACDPNDGWRMVLNPMDSRYVEGFDSSQEYEFNREGWEAPSVFKLADSYPAFNIAGLWFRALAQRGHEVAPIGGV